MNNLIYLAVPYSFDPDLSFQIANKEASFLMQQGNVVFSPISHSHPISLHMPENYRRSHEFWMMQDLNVLKRCDVLVVIYPFYDYNNKDYLVNSSKGCQKEIETAQSLNIPIIKYYVKIDRYFREEKFRENAGCNNT